MKYFRLLLVTASVYCCTPAWAQRLPERPDTLPPTTAHYLQQPADRADVYRPSVCGLLIPGAMLTYGFVALGNHTLQDFNHSTKAELMGDRHFSTSIDDYLQWSPAVAVYALNAAGAKGEHNFRDRTIIYGISTLIMASSVRYLKTTTDVERPDGSNHLSFPSGHTATAFAAAEFMRMEYRHTNRFLSMTGYAAAAATGALRMYNNRHWFSDIAGGAGLGMLSTQAAYAIYPLVKRYLLPHQKNTSTLFMPYYDPELKAGGCRLLVVRN